MYNKEQYFYALLFYFYSLIFLQVDLTENISYIEIADALLKLVGDLFQNQRKYYFNVKILIKNIRKFAKNNIKFGKYHKAKQL